MSWVTVIWSMVASACITLAAIHVLIWFVKGTTRANLLFSVTALGTAGFAFCELWMMRSGTPAEFATALRLGHAAMWVWLLALVGFVRFYLQAGRAWLAWTVCGLRTVSLLLNFLTGQNLNYREITGLRHISFLGEPVAIAEGVPNPWMLVGQLSALVFLIFVTDAAVTVWRRGDRRKALLVGGSIVFFALSATTQSVLVFWGIVHSPLTVSLFYQFLIAAMAYELSRDILDAAQLSRDLHESEARMVLAATATNLGIWRLDLERNDMWATDRWRVLFGFTPSERLDLDRFLQRLHPDDRDTVRQAFAHAIAGDGTYETEYRAVLPGGQIHWIASNGRVEFSGAGKPVLIRGVSLDITKRKQTEMEAQQQRVELAHLSRVAMLGELSGSLAHELNQPLTAILSNAQAALRFLARDDADLDEVRGILKDIVDEDKRAGEVIRRLRVLLHKGQVEYQPFDLNEMVREVLRLVRVDLTNQRVTARTELAHALPVANADRVQVQQVLLNLVMNACDAMNTVPAEDQTITISTALGDREGVRVSVADRGVGLQPDALERVFEPFFTTKPQGMGLGLSVCRTIVTAHGGKLWAVNNPEQGATFHFTLPVVREPSRSARR